MAIKTILAGLIPPPFTTKLFSEGSILSQAWEEYFRQIFDCLNPLGKERSSQIENNVTTASPLIDMQFDGSQVSLVIVEFFIQRFHEGPSSSAVGGTLILSYNAKTNAWSISNAGPHAGVTFFVNPSTGQVSYTSSNISGTKQVSKVTWRARTLAAKVNKPAAGWS